MEVYQSIRLSIPYARSLEKKKLRLAELLTLVDQRLHNQKKDQLIVYLNDNLPSYNWSNETNKEL
jgi:hypothetical protein